MTEQEWLDCTDPKPMLAFLRNKASDRKLRLFACACARDIWDLLADECSQTAVEVAERFADGLAAAEEFVAAKAAARQAQESAFRRWAGDEPDDLPWLAAGTAVAATSGEARAASRSAGGAALSRHRRGEVGIFAVRDGQVATIRDIVGNPFGPVIIDPARLSTTVTNLAQAAYEERIMPSGELDPARLAVLSDALEEAGCDDGDILNHLRSPGPHVRGCWALDLAFGKE